MRWSHLSIGQRLGLGFVVLLAINIASLLVVRTYSQQSAQAETEFASRLAPRLESALQLRGDIFSVAVAARAVQVSPTETNRFDFSNALQSARSEVARLAMLNVGDPAFSTILPAVDAYLLAAEQTRGQQMGDATQNALQERRLALVDNLDAYIARHRRAVAESMSAMATAQQRVRDGVISAAIVSLSAFLLIALLITGSVRRSARDLLRAARAMAESDWRPALDLPVDQSDARSGNELMQLRGAFRTSATAIEVRERRLKAGRAVASAAAAGLSTELIANCALQVIADHVNAELGVVYASAPDSSLVAVAARGLGREAHELPEPHGLPLDCARERRTMRIDEIPSDTEFQVRIGFDSAPARGVISVPLAVRDRVLGVIVLASLRPLDDDAVLFVESAAQQLAIGFENVRAFEQIQLLLQQSTAANERIQVQSEELQVQNEELQAQSEEIQAQNEELQAQGEEIRAQNEDLVVQSDTLRAQSESLAEVDERKNDFIGMLAHELRNPLATISNSLFVLRESGNGRAAPTRTLDVMQRQMRQLQRLTDDLLDITRIAKGKLNLRVARVDLAEVVRECVEDQRLAAARGKVRLTLTAPEQPILIDGDRSRLSQVLCNLIDNAVKASREDSDVQIAVHLHASPARATVHIVDHGTGIAKDVLPTLFQPFVQAAGPHRSSGGLGLGLALVRTITGLHGGTVEAFSEGADRGAAFVVTLPLESTEAPDQPATGTNQPRDPSASAPQSCRIQIIEDNADAAETLRTALELAGHSVSVAHTAESGLAMVRTTRPDVLICDIGLPDRSGYEVASEVARAPELKATRLVALTGYATPADQRRALEAGFHHHFAKPVTIEQLGTVLKPSAAD